MTVTRGALLITTLAALIACSRPVLAPEVQQIGQVTRQSIEAYCTVLGHHLSYSIFSDSLANEPTWAGPEAGPPPLSMDQAVDISRREIPEYFPDASNWEVRKLNLQSLCCPRRWFYIVGWLPPGESGDALSIPVLLSGRALKLARDDRSRDESPSVKEGKAPSNYRLQATVGGLGGAGPAHWAFAHRA